MLHHACSICLILFLRYPPHEERDYFWANVRDHRGKIQASIFDAETLTGEVKFPHEAYERDFTPPIYGLRECRLMLRQHTTYLVMWPKSCNLDLLLRDPHHMSFSAALDVTIQMIKDKDPEAERYLTDLVEFGVHCPLAFQEKGNGNGQRVRWDYCASDSFNDYNALEFKAQNDVSKTLAAIQDIDLPIQKKKKMIVQILKILPNSFEMCQEQVKCYFSCFNVPFNFILIEITYFICCLLF